jgi:hypothetical protein
MHCMIKSECAVFDLPCPKDSMHDVDIIIAKLNSVKVSQIYVKMAYRFDVELQGSVRNGQRVFHPLVD